MLVFLWQKINNKLTTLERMTFGKDFQISVAVVGCGYSGVELAATIAERLQNRGIVRAINVDPMICPNAPPGNREAALKVSCLEYEVYAYWNLNICFVQLRLPDAVSLWSTNIASIAYDF